MWMTLVQSLLLAKSLNQMASRYHRDGLKKYRRHFHLFKKHPHQIDLSVVSDLMDIIILLELEN
jgi:hypothetical protein